MGTCDWKGRKPFYKMGSRTVLQGLASIKWKYMENILVPGKSWDGNTCKLEVREGALPHNPRYP
jgi:hypothetical protein